jgi:DNA polymerase-3 subunit delta'
MNIIEIALAKVWHQLQARRAQLPHALLISGQRGIGKFDLARSASPSRCSAKMRTESGTACGKCLACGWLAQGNHPDLRLLQPEALASGESSEAGEGEEVGKKKPSQQITIDQVRALDDFLHVGTHRHGARLVLLNPAEAMNRATANALLKSLEEPIAGTRCLYWFPANHHRLAANDSQPLPGGSHASADPCGKRGRDQVAAVMPAFATPKNWLALAGGSPLLALELSVSGERVLLDSLLAQVSRTAPGSMPWRLRRRISTRWSRPKSVRHL